jgi:hypothetical protein
VRLLHQSFSATMVERQTTAGVVPPQPAPELPAEAGLSSGDVVVMDEDLSPPPFPGVTMS